MKFIDLFAGLGGFHVALEDLGHKCVFACEINNGLRELYELNFKMPIHGNIKLIEEGEIPSHDILCAGFPCQPFSKAGYQEGLADIDRGTLFYDIERILIYHQPKYFILENVANLINHDGGRTWEKISYVLKDELKYNIAHKKLSPHQFGVPQIRERIFIVGSKSNLDVFTWPDPNAFDDVKLNEVLDVNPIDAKPLSARELECLFVWQEFLDRLPEDAKLPSFPIWAMEFGATYPYQDRIPFNCSSRELDEYSGSFGHSLKGINKDEQLKSIPNYARANQKHNALMFPMWKQRFIRQNRDFYITHKRYIDPVLPKIERMHSSWQKLEWNCQGEERDLSKYVIQFRGSGVRIKRPSYSPALVSSSSTQIPVIGWEGRYLTASEAARLQSLERIKIPESGAFTALGNAVNAKLVGLIAAHLFGKNKEKEVKKSPIVGCHEAA